ncbi:MAG: cap protein [Patescibacteria group bacterium]|nr:cap protein [Patescibacteria group bacterium]MDQ5958754.1 cap protein [Patescibacteria group bacterium]
MVVKKKLNKKIISLVVIVIIAIVILLFVFLKPSSKNVSNNKPLEQSQDIPVKNITRIIAVGDQLPHDAINKQALKPDGSYDYLQFYKEIKNNFNNVQGAYCNQEVPAAGSVAPISGYPVFNAPEQFAKDLSALGCNIINLANNHMFDKGQAGINATRAVWDTLPKKAIAGANRNQEEQNSIQYFTENNIKFAYLAFAEYSNIPTSTNFAINIYSEAVSKPLVTQAANNADVVIVSMHWGTEYSPTENDFQKNAAKVLAESGADVIIGAGPHVLQPVDKIVSEGGRETLVWYSLGNFLSAQLDLASLIGGISVMDFAKSENGAKLESIGFIPSYMHYEWTPQQKAADALLERKNFMVYPLEKATDPLSRSLFNTTVEAQTNYVKNVLNTHINVPLLPTQ